MPLRIFVFLCLIPCGIQITRGQSGAHSNGYEHFDAAIYARVYEVIEMKDLDWLQERFDVMQEHVRVSKVYLETHRDTIIADEETLEMAKQFFADRGVCL